MAEVGQDMSRGGGVTCREVCTQAFGCVERLCEALVTTMTLQSEREAWGECLAEKHCAWIWARSLPCCMRGKGRSSAEAQPAGIHLTHPITQAPSAPCRLFSMLVRAALQQHLTQTNVSVCIVPHASLPCRLGQLWFQ